MCRPNPPDELLKAIKFQGVSLEITLPTFGGREIERYIPLILMVFAAIERFFKLSGQQKITQKSLNLVGGVWGEALVNAVEHGNQEDPRKEIMTGLWLGEKGVLFAVRDEGDFFKQASIKELVESRISLPSTKKGDLRGGAGLECIYQADHILVKEGTLYLVLLSSSLTA